MRVETSAVAAVLTLGLSLALGSALAHPGGLNSEGCHNNRKTGDYHCHNRGGSSAPSQDASVNGFLESPGAGPDGADGGRPFRNCSEARAAGRAPIRRGEPGFGSHLDRDGDGIGCEPYRGR